MNNDTSNLVLNKRYKVSMEHTEDCEAFYRHRDYNGQCYFSEELIDEPKWWTVYLRWEEIPEDEFKPYTLETFPLDNSGMVRAKDWKDRSFTTDLTTGTIGVSVCDNDIIAFKDAIRIFEWLNKDGSTSPFGVKI